jgi:hypothetical protein
VITSGIGGAEALAAVLLGHQLEHFRAGLAARLQALDVPLALQVLADGDEFHFRRNDAPARVVHLRDVGLALPGTPFQIEAQLGKLRVVQSFDAVL